MKPAAFDLCQPETVDEALAVLAELGDAAVVLAGGLSLGAMLNMRVVQPAMVVDVNRVDELDRVEPAAGAWLRTGALVRQADALASPEIAAAVPLLAVALPNVGHYQTRSRGTLAGSVAHADPSSEIPLALACLGGEVELAAAHGVRRVPAREFADGLLSTRRAPDELVTGLLWPRAGPGAGVAFREVAERHGDFAICAAAAWAQPAASGALAYGLGLGGVADRPLTFTGELGAVPDPGGWVATVDAIVADATADLDALDDPRASRAFREHLARHLGRAVLLEALEACGRG